MNPITHLLVGWSLGAPVQSLSRRDRGWIAAAGVAPDIDGAGIVAEFLTRGSDQPLLWWSEYHHRLGHNVGFCVLVTAAAFAATRRASVATLAAVSCHLHLVGDLVGSRGPDGYQWPIPYLLPFASRPEFTVSWQWELNAWPNVALSLALLTFTFWLAWARGISPLEFVSAAANQAFVRTLRARVRRAA